MKSASVFRLKNGRSASIFPPRSGYGNGSMPRGRRKRTGGLSTMLQPPAVMRIASQVGLHRSM